MSQPAFFAAILTLFPELFPGVVGASLPGKALKDGVWGMETFDIRSFATDKHATVDDTPYGGGAGMVMRADVLDAAVRGAETKCGAFDRKIYLSPRGKVLNQAMVKELAATPKILLLCGRYEGVDQRVLDAQGFDEISIGDYVLAGGELAAMVLLEACVRLLPGVLGNATTTNEESFESGLLEYPHFTRPPEWQGRSVPEVLLSGHHARVREWRLEQAKQLTERRRPDLWAAFQGAKSSR